MIDVDEFIAHMVGDPDYDPIKAREYYLRTRKLKGRHPAAPPPVPVGRHPAKVLPVKKHAAPLAKSTAKPKRKSAAQERKEAEAHVAALQGKLDQLHKVLAALVKAAKARSGVKPVAPAKKAAPKKTAGHQPTAKEKLTAAQKAKKAKDAKDAYDKAHPDAKAAELTKKIAEVTQKIHDMKAEIAAAQHKSQTKTSSSVGARATTHK